MSARALLPVLAAFAMLAAPVAGLGAPTLKMPAMHPQTDWLKPPPGKVLGDISAVAVDTHDNVWVLHRPRSVAEADRARAAPAVLEYDKDGKFLHGFGGPDASYDWPTVEHSLAVDAKGRVWVTGNFRAAGGPADDMMLVFTGDGKFIRQIGKPGASGGNSDTKNLHAAADIFVDDARHEVYVADGYGNRRVIVFDTETGAFKRMWSAFGSQPPNEPGPAPRVDGAPFTPESGPGPYAFNGVHGVEIARDGRVYVSDRVNQRIQVFTRQGRYLDQVFIDRNMPSVQSTSGIAFSPDAAQRYMYVADWGNACLLVLDRRALKQLGSLCGKGAAPGQFNGPHLIATDSKGNLYVAEVQGRRLQRFVIDPR
jgi:DNA-binding beta-propeller fold protein YncE